MSLFGAAPAPSYLAHVKAGKCSYDTETKMVTPDTRRGLLFLERQDDDLLHLKWKVRGSSSTAEDDLIIFPDDAELKLVPGQRVYVLAFKSSSARLFFWIQESSEAVDAERLSKFNKVMNDGGDAFGGAGGLDRLDSMVSETSGQLEQLEQILAAFKVSDGESTTPSPAIDVAAIEPLLRDPHLSSILFPGLPAKKSTAETLASPAFKTALGTLVRAVESGQLESLLADGADLDEEVVAFLKSLKKNGMDESS